MCVDKDIYDLTNEEPAYKLAEQAAERARNNAKEMRAKGTPAGDRFALEFDEDAKYYEDLAKRLRGK